VAVVAAVAATLGRQCPTLFPKQLLPKQHLMTQMLLLSIIARLLPLELGPWM
jgi:hypothetical protein